MNNNKVILMFCDLEGTLLNEKNGTLDARKLFRFFDQINKIQQTTKSTVYMHLLSPIPLDIMEKVLDKLDTGNKKIKTVDKIKNPEAFLLIKIKGSRGFLLSGKNAG